MELEKPHDEMTNEEVFKLFRNQKSELNFVKFLTYLQLESDKQFGEKDEKLDT